MSIEAEVELPQPGPGQIRQPAEPLRQRTQPTTVTTIIVLRFVAVESTTIIAKVQQPGGGHLRREPGHRPATRTRASREARPERVAQRAARQREAERVVLVHRVGNEEEAAAGVEQGEWGGGQRVHCDCKHYAYEYH